MKNVKDYLTETILDITDYYDLAPGIAGSVLEELLPEITGVESLLTLPVGSLLLGNDGTGWTRGPNPGSAWTSALRGGYGGAVDDLRWTTQRFVDHEAPFRLVWVP